MVASGRCWICRCRIDSCPICRREGGVLYSVQHRAMQDTSWWHIRFSLDQVTLVENSTMAIAEYGRNERMPSELIVLVALQQPSPILVGGIRATDDNARRTKNFLNAGPAPTRKGRPLMWCRVSAVRASLGASPPSTLWSQRNGGLGTCDCET